MRSRRVVPARIESHNMFRGIVQNGKVVLDGSAPLPDGTEVDVTPSGRRTGSARSSRASAARPRKTGAPRRSKPRSVLETLKPFIGALKGLPRDASANVD